MSKTFLLEVLLEDLPTRVMKPAMEQIRAGIERALAGARLSFERVEPFGTNRRLGLLVHGLQETQEIYEEELTGPPAKTAFDAEGKPTQAALKFAEGRGAKAADIYRAATPKGEYAAVRVKRGGHKASEILAEAVPAILGKMEFPVVMRWNGEAGAEHRFVRVVCGVVALMDGEVVPFSFAGVQSGRKTRANRFLNGDAEVNIPSADSYLDVMLKSRVVASVEMRKKHIADALEAKAHEAGGEFVRDDALLDTVTAQSECPGVLMGSFEEKFLALPREALVCSMREHQKYFAVEDKGGRLLPLFLTAAEVRSENAEPILHNHAKVLRARLQDAMFFYSSDRKQPLETRLEKLKGVVFHKELGSYFDKAQRLEKLAPRLAELAGHAALAQDLTAAARLCKCDLMTAMVGEFPTLQGIAGGIYAREEGLPESVWRAVYEHYRPEGLDDEPPSGAAGKILSLADKVDTVLNFFYAGERASGSKDPFALRRAGNGIVLLLAELDGQKLSIWSLLDEIKTFYPHHGRHNEAVVKFLLERLEFLAESKNFSMLEIAAVWNAGWPKPEHVNYKNVNIKDALSRLDALRAMRGAEDLSALAVAFKRARNILREAKETVPERANLDMAKERAESALLKTVRKMDDHVQDDMKKPDYETALKRLASMRLSVDEFFNGVMVMCEDEALRKNRLAILAETERLFLRVADISQLAISTKEG